MDVVVWGNLGPYATFIITRKQFFSVLAMLSIWKQGALAD